MRIDFLLPHLKPAGGVKVIVGYAAGLAARQHQVNVCVPLDKGRLAMKIYNLAGIKPGWLSRSRFRVVRFKEYCRLPAADVMVSDSWLVTSRLADALPSAGNIVHFIQHDERLYHGDPAEVSRTYRRPFPKVVVSSWIQEMISHDFGQKAELLLNPLDKERYHFQASSVHDGIRILILNHEADWKGAREGMDIAREIKSKYGNVKIVQFGSRSRQPWPGGDEYHYNPRQEKLSELYSSCDIFLCPSWDEGFGLPSLEAMACGCAVATYDNGGSRDFCFHNQTALVAARKDQAELKSLVEKLVVDSRLRERIRAGGLELMKNWPTPQEQTAQLEEILLKHNEPKK